MISVSPQEFVAHKIIPIIDGLAFDRVKTIYPVKGRSCAVPTSITRIEASILGIANFEVESVRYRAEGSRQILITFSVRSEVGDHVEFTVNMRTGNVTAEFTLNGGGCVLSEEETKFHYSFPKGIEKNDHGEFYVSEEVFLASSLEFQLPRGLISQIDTSKWEVSAAG